MLFLFFENYALIKFHVVKALSLDLCSMGSLPPAKNITGVFLMP